MPASIISVNVGRAEPTPHSTVGRTGIGKQPVSGAVRVGPAGYGESGLDGDTVCDAAHHGGADQAVYAYSTEDLATWSAALDRPLTPGRFGENLTTAGIELNACVVGERWSVGPDLVLQVSDPRIPCRTFAGHLGEDSWVRRFTRQSLSGTYLRVLTPGVVSAGMTITVTDRPAHGVTVGTAFRALTTEPELLPLLIDAEGLSVKARERAATRVARAASVPSLS